MQDYGGPVGFRLALKNPARVQRLINHGRMLGARFAIENIQPVHLNGLIANLDRRPAVTGGTGCAATGAELGCHE